MDTYSTRRRQQQPHPHSRWNSWCCSFSDPPPSSPETLTVSHDSKAPKHQTLLSKSAHSFPNSPSQGPTKSPSSGLGLMGRIKSPGRVSPIPQPSRINVAEETMRTPLRNKGGVFDVRLNLKGKNGGGYLVLELDSGVLRANSSVFAELISGFEEEGRYDGRMCRIEVAEVENLGVFRETIELMFVEEEDDITKRLLKIGVYRSIGILEVSSGIMFNKGVLSCLKYLEAVPWNEEEEEKLRNLFTRFKFDDATTKDILARLFLTNSVDVQQNLPRQLLWSITTCVDSTARNELKSLVKGLLCKSSVYEKDHWDLTKEEIYAVCQSCLNSLMSLFEEACDSGPCEKLPKMENSKTLIARISRQVDNINWLLEIMLDRQVAEDFVDMWTCQKDLLKLHKNTSPMVRYELSRVSATLFIALGTRKLHCRFESRSGLLQAWFCPMLLDFGWLQRCKKGLDMKVLEAAMGQTLLTLPLNQQYTLFMEWFCHFSKYGKECPNLSQAFQIWWRRSFLRGGPETDAVEST